MPLGNGVYWWKLPHTSVESSKFLGSCLGEFQNTTCRPPRSQLQTSRSAFNVAAKKMAENIKQLAKKLISLYDTRTSLGAVGDIVKEIYTDDATLADPFFMIMGHKAIANHFIFMRGLFSGTAIEIKFVHART